MATDALLFMFGGAVIYSQLAQGSTQTLLAILIMCVITGVFFWQYQQSRQADQQKERKQEAKLNEAVKGRSLAESESYDIKKFPKDGKFKYLPQNQTLVKIAEDIRYVRAFDKARFGDLLLHMDRFQKTYIYLLANRTPCDIGIPSLLDLRSQIADLLYSMYLIIPKTMKHAYGLDPFAVLEENIELFTSLSRTMLQVVEGHCKTSIPYTQPYEKHKSKFL